MEWILLVVAGLVIGILSSLTGLGGGFLVVPFLIYLGRSTQLAVGTAFIVILLIALSSLTAHYRMGNIELKTGLMLAVGGIVGAQIGPLILKNLSPQNFKLFFAGILVALAVWLVIQSRGAA